MSQRLLSPLFLTLFASVQLLFQPLLAGDGCVLGLFGADCCCAPAQPATGEVEDGGCCSSEAEEPAPAPGDAPGQSSCDCIVLPTREPVAPVGALGSEHGPILLDLLPAAAPAAPLPVCDLEPAPPRRTRPPATGPPLHLLHRVFLI